MLGKYWEMKQGKGHKSVHYILSSSLPLWATEAHSCWGILEETVDYTSEIVQLKGEEIELFILQPHQSLAECFSREHELPGISYLPSTLVKSVREPSGDESRVLAAGLSCDKEIHAGH